MSGDTASLIGQPLSYCALTALLILAALVASSPLDIDAPEAESERRAIECENTGKSMEDCAYIEMQRMLVR